MLMKLIKIVSYVIFCLLKNLKKIKNSSSKISVITWAPGLVIPNDDLGFLDTVSVLISLDI